MLRSENPGITFPENPGITFPKLLFISSRPKFGSFWDIVLFFNGKKSAEQAGSSCWIGSLGMGPLDSKFLFKFLALKCSVQKYIVRILVAVLVYEWFGVDVKDECKKIEDFQDALLRYLLNAELC